MFLWKYFLLSLSFMIFFQVWLNFDPMKETLKIQCQIYIWKLEYNEYFRSTILHPFQLEPEQKRTCDNESHDKKTKHIHTSATNLLHIRTGNLDWRKRRHCKSKAREMDYLCCGEMNVMLTASAKILELEGNVFAIHSAFMDNCPISVTRFSPSI